MTQEPGAPMSLTEHLSELRDRLIKCVGGALVGFALCWGYSEQLFEFIKKPIAPFLGASGLVFTAVMDKFMAHLKVSLLGGVILTCPLWLYHLWAFIAPGLYKNERKFALIFITLGSLLFVLGVAFAYYLAIPTALEYLMNFGGSADKAMITIGEYLSFFLIMMAVFGLVFELPLVLTLLGVVGVVDVVFLRKNRRYAIVIMAVVAAVVTPTPDFFSMMLVLVPLSLLYELSIILIRVFVSKPAAVMLKS